MNEKMMLQLAAGFLVGYMLAKASKSPTATTHNQITDQGQWWTFAGSWQ